MGRIAKTKLTDEQLKKEYKRKFKDFLYAHITFEEYKKIRLDKTFTIKSLKYPIKVVKGKIQL